MKYKEQDSLITALRHPPVGVRQIRKKMYKEPMWFCASALMACASPALLVALSLVKEEREKCIYYIRTRAVFTSLDTQMKRHYAAYYSLCYEVEINTDWDLGRKSVGVHELNDKHLFSFAQIADFYESHVDKYADKMAYVLNRVGAND